MSLKTERTTLSLDRDDHKLLAEIAEANGWPIGDATRRAIHALFALDEHLKAMSAREGGKAGKVLERVARDVDPALLLRPKSMSKVETDDGNWGIRVADLTFFEEEDTLFARREIDGRVEVYEVREGRLILQYPTVASIASLT